MAKILIEFDTVTKAASASIDGVAVQNFNSASIYPRYMGDSDDDEPQLFTCSVQSVTEDEEHKTTKYESVYASEQKTVAQDIANFLSK